MNNKLFLERTELKIETDDLILNLIYPKDFNIDNPEIINGVEIKWTYKSVNEEPNEFNIEIKGLTTTTVAKIKLRDKVRLVAGYGTDIGEIAVGIVSRKEVSKEILKLKCREVPSNFRKIVSSAFAPNTTASQIIKSLAEDMGFTVKQCDLKNDKVYSIGESILGSGLYEIAQIVKDCDSKMTTKNDFIYIYHNEMNDRNKIKISYDSGLLEEPKPKNIEEISYKVEKSKKEKSSKKNTKNKKKTGKNATKKESEQRKSSAEKEKQELQYDYEIKCLLLYMLKKGDFIELISNEISTICQIVEISDISDFVMTLKVLVVNNDKSKNTAKNKSTGKAKNKNKKSKGNKK